MGVGLPYAMGVKLANPDATVACVTGEGSIQMCIQELSTCKQYHLPIKIVILNNRYLGMVRQWQEFDYGNRYATVVHGRAARLREAGRGLRPRRHADREAGRRRSRAAAKRSQLKDRLVFLDFLTDQTENVFPMVPGGKGMTEMMLGRKTCERRPPNARRTTYGRIMRHIISVLLENEPGALSRVVGPVLGARLQHRIADRRADRGPDAVAHDDRHHRLGRGDRADHQAAEPADRGGQGGRPDRGRATSSAS